jgi:serine phosphatase RsbU (regulator of sigma subunit)
MPKDFKIVVLEKDPSKILRIEKVLLENSLNFTLTAISSQEKLSSVLEIFSPDIILFDDQFSELSSLEALFIARSKYQDVPFIIITDYLFEWRALDCIQAGANDYVLKDNLARLPLAIRNIHKLILAQQEKKEVLALHEELTHAYQEIEENNKSMTDSINYAKLIQEAMLPEKAVLTNYFPNSLIIFRPKDIVSGDFYWFVERDNKLLIAVADCTGHGVPGSLMSMIGYSLLNEIVNVKKIRKPAEILSKLNKGIRRTLKQDKTGNQRCDGMDIALCSIDREQRIIEFAGANRHLVYFRDKTMEMVKGNKFGIGGLHDESIITFTNNYVNYDEGDIIYMCTDGYADQFGGTKGKRMMTRNMNKILEKSLTFGVAEQEQLLNHWLDKWQGNYEQTDDILLIGIQL